jgi:hypothetical protein
MVRRLQENVRMFSGWSQQSVRTDSDTGSVLSRRELLSHVVLHEKIGNLRMA